MSSNPFELKRDQVFHEKYCSSSHISERKIWSIVKFELVCSTPDHRCNTHQNLFTCGLSGRWFNVVSKQNDKYLDSWRDLSVMCLVFTFALFEVWVLHESIDMDDRYDGAFFLLILGFFFSLFTESWLIQCSGIDLLNSYCDRCLLSQIPSSLLVETYTIYSFVSITHNAQNKNCTTSSCSSPNDQPCRYLSIDLKIPHSPWWICSYELCSSVKTWIISSYPIHIEDIFLCDNPIQIIWYHTEILHRFGVNIWSFRFDLQNS